MPSNSLGSKGMNLLLTFPAASDMQFNKPCAVFWLIQIKTSGNT
jgi:hypothetical protein